MLYECLLIIGVLALTFIVPHMIIGVIWQASAPGWFEWLHLAAVLGAYCTWFWCHGGQTLAMRTWRIRVVDATSGTLLTWPRAVLRYLLCWPSIGFFGAGMMWALLDRDRQFLHDRLAGTRLIDTGK